MAEPGIDSVAKVDRKSMSVEGRTVVALERISDQLSLIAGKVSRWPAASSEAKVSRRSTGATKAEKCTWENEGGSVAASPELLPEGITRTLVARYQVGPYRYTDLDTAIAELRRRQKDD